MSRFPTIIDRPDGVVTGVNIKRIAEMPFMVLPDVPFNQISVPSGQSVQQITMSISGEGPAQINEFTAERQLANSQGQAIDGGNYPVAYVGATPVDVATVFIQIQDGQSMRALMNGACHIDTIFGNYLAGNKAYPLAEALYIDEQRKILISATDLAKQSSNGVGINNNIRPMMSAQRFLSRVVDTDLSKTRKRMDQRQYMTMPYFYTLDNAFSNLAANGTNVETISIGQDAHFELFQLSAVATGGLGSFLINIVDQATGESIFDAPQGVTLPQSSGLVLGSAAFPVRLHEPRFFEVRTKLIVTLINLNIDPNTQKPAANSIFITLGGRALADRMWSE